MPGPDAAAGPAATKGDDVTSPQCWPDAEEYPDHFETQVAARCGMHALNNALGEPLHTADDMTRACKIYLQQSRAEGNPEVRTDHEGPRGWYSSEVLSTAVTSTTVWRRGRVEHIMHLEPLRENPDALRTSIGAVVNIRNEHWVALRWLRDAVWLLDSVRSRPIRLAWPMYLAFLAEHPAAYRIEVAPRAE